MERLATPAEKLGAAPWGRNSCKRSSRCPWRLEVKVTSVFLEIRSPRMSASIVPPRNSPLRFAAVSLPANVIRPVREAAA